jgi:predicted dehydrogenase
LVANIAIIGAGQLGSRHLQGLSQITHHINAYVVDPSPQSIETAKMRYKEVTEVNGTKIESISFYEDYYLLPDTLDVVIVATNSNVRRKIVETLLNEKTVKNLILEKFLFQEINDFTVVGELLREKNVKAWVNCPRRMWDFYKSLKKEITGAYHIDYSVTGSNIGIGSNSIHFLDQLAFLSEDTSFKLSSAYLDKEIIESKRSGYIEFTGSLSGTTSKGHRFSVTSYRQEGVPLVVQINSNRVRCVIRETEQKAFIAYQKDNWAWQEVNFRVMFQSELTHLAVEQILDNGSCALTTYEESSALHIKVLTAFCSHLEKIQSKEVSKCPIT